MDNDGANPLMPIDWASLRAFIAENEAHEMLTGRPAPLTKAQLEAVATLVPAPRPPPTPAPEDTRNWIGILNGKSASYL